LPHEKAFQATLFKKAVPGPQERGSSVFVVFQPLELEVHCRQGFRIHTMTQILWRMILGNFYTYIFYILGDVADAFIQNDLHH
jgi:hypothetical protein